MNEWVFRTEKGEEIHPEGCIFPLTSAYTPGKPYRVIGTGFFIHKPGIFLTARHCLFDSNDEPWADLLCMAHHPLEIKWLIDFKDTDLAIGQTVMNDCEECKKHKMISLCTWKPEKDEVMIHWGCNQSEIQLQHRQGNLDYLAINKVIEGFKGKFEEFHPSGISIAPWPCYMTNVEFPHAASGGPVTNGIGRVCGINSTSSEGGGYSTAVLIKNILDSKVPRHFLINDQKRKNDITFGEVLKQYGVEVLEGD